MHCPLASGLGTNILSTSLPLAQVLAQFEFCNQMADLEDIAQSCAVILAARDLNEQAGKHRLLQTSSQPMSEQF